jgi:hypothetical protein
VQRPTDAQHCRKQGSHHLAASQVVLVVEAATLARIYPKG